MHARYFVTALMLIMTSISAVGPQRTPPHTSHVQLEDDESRPLGSLPRLFEAMQNCDARVVNAWLARHVIEINRTDGFGRTALHQAFDRVHNLGRNRVAVLQALWQQRDRNGTRIDLNARAHNGRTALHHAALAGDADAVIWLRAHSVDTSITSNDGKTALDEISEAAFDNELYERTRNAFLVPLVDRDQVAEYLR